MSTAVRGRPACEHTGDRHCQPAVRRLQAISGPRASCTCSAQLKLVLPPAFWSWAGLLSCCTEVSESKMTLSPGTLGHQEQSPGTLHWRWGWRTDYKRPACVPVLRRPAGSVLDSREVPAHICVLSVCHLSWPGCLMLLSSLSQLPGAVELLPPVQAYPSPVPWRKAGKKRM